MSVAVGRENFFWHKLHSLTGIIPVGFYMLQHLTLNSFSLAGPDKFNGVIAFFGSIPWYVLLTMEIALIWTPLIFHAVYGLFIVNRGQPNYFGTKYGWSQNRMYTLQRWSGLFLVAFLLFHMSTTTALKYVKHDDALIMYNAWQTKLKSGFYWQFAVYIVGILAASYHLSYGIWNFCIRWGITIGEKAQARVQKFSFGMFICVTLLGWAALVGFLIHAPSAEVDTTPAPNISLST